MSFPYPIPLHRALMATKPARPAPPAGTVPVMCHGHIVCAREISRESADEIVFEFVCHYDTGATRLCLDFGNGYCIRAGERFHASAVQLDRAAYWLSQRGDPS